jgi:hypothetical protein
MPVYRPLRVSIFIYDVVRLLGMLWILPLLAPPQASSAFSFPLLVYTAPNALFLLAAFFLVVRFEEYASYTYLYIAGKAVAIAANLGWFFFSLRQLGSVLSQQIEGILPILGFLLFLAGFDALSVLGMAALITYIQSKPGAGGKKAAPLNCQMGDGADDTIVPEVTGLDLLAANDAGPVMIPGAEDGEK